MTDPASEDATVDDDGEHAAEPDDAGHGWGTADDPDGAWSAPSETVDSSPGPAATDATADADATGSAHDSDSDTDGSLDRRSLVGLVVLVVGVILLVVPAPGLIEAETRLLVAGVATAALILGLVYAGDERVTSRRVWRPPEPERGCEIPRPGESFEGLSGSVLDERLRAVAIEVLTQRTRCTRETAEGRLASGEWTSDRLAATALSDAIRPRRRRRLLARLTGADLERRARERALAELDARRSGRGPSAPLTDAQSDATADDGAEFEAVDAVNADRGDLGSAWEDGVADRTGWDGDRTGWDGDRTDAQEVTDS